MRPLASALVLEDNQHMRFMLSELLKLMDVEYVDLVATIAEARTALETFVYDVALIDVGLEGECGLDLVREIRLDRKHAARRMPMLVVSGQNQVSAIATARDAGADAYLLKPVSIGALSRRVNTVLNHPRLYVDVPGYFGPDRRRENSSTYDGPERRRETHADHFLVE